MNPQNTDRAKNIAWMVEKFFQWVQCCRLDDAGGRYKLGVEAAHYLAACDDGTAQGAFKYYNTIRDDFRKSCQADDRWELYNCGE